MQWSRRRNPVAVDLWSFSVAFADAYAESRTAVCWYSVLQHRLILQLMISWFLRFESYFILSYAGAGFTSDKEVMIYFGMFVGWLVSVSAGLLKNTTPKKTPQKATPEGKSVVFLSRGLPVSKNCLNQIFEMGRPRDKKLLICFWWWSLSW